MDHPEFNLRNIFGGVYPHSQPRHQWRGVRGERDILIPWDQNITLPSELSPSLLGKGPGDGLKLLQYTRRLNLNLEMIGIPKTKRLFLAKHAAEGVFRALPDKGGIV
jgi:hypothetical protein